MLPAVSQDLERIAPGLPFCFNPNFLVFRPVQLQVDEISEL